MNRFLVVFVCSSLAALAQTSSTIQGITGLPFHLHLGYALDGPTVVSYTYLRGPLPPGVSFTSDNFGEFTGVPVTPGAYPVTLLRQVCTTSQGCTSTEVAENIVVRAPCATIDKLSDLFDFSGGTHELHVTAPPDCDWGASTSNLPGSGIPELPYFVHLSFPGGMRGSGTVAYSINPETTGGSYTFVIGDTLFTIYQRRTQPIFTDVPPASDYFDAINLMAQRQLTHGCSTQPALFCHQNPVTRGQAAVFIVRALLGDMFPYRSEPYFTDVPQSHIFFPYIQKFAELQITNGCSATEFCPDRPVTRGEAIVQLIRAKLGDTFTLNPLVPQWFNDVPPSHPFYQYIQKALELHVTTGCTLGLFCPDAPTPREQFAVLLVRAILNETVP